MVFGLYVLFVSHYSKKRRLQKEFKSYTFGQYINIVWFFTHNYTNKQAKKQANKTVVGGAHL